MGAMTLSESDVIILLVKELYPNVKSKIKELGINVEVAHIGLNIIFAFSKKDIRHWVTSSRCACIASLPSTIEYQGFGFPTWKKEILDYKNPKLLDEIVTTFVKDYKCQMRKIESKK